MKGHPGLLLKVSAQSPFCLEQQNTDLDRSPFLPPPVASLFSLEAAQPLLEKQVQNCARLENKPYDTRLEIQVFDLL